MTDIETAPDEMKMPVLAAKVREVLGPRIAHAEQALADANRRLESAKGVQDGAARELAALQRAVTEPVLLATLATEFMAALKGERADLEAFLGQNKDRDLRSVVFGLRWDVEAAVRRREREAG